MMDDHYPHINDDKLRDMTPRLPDDDDHGETLIALLFMGGVGMAVGVFIGWLLFAPVGAVL